MKRVYFVARSYIVLTTFIFVLYFISSSSAALIPDSVGQETVTGSLSGSSIEVDITYSIYDGIGPDNPLPATGDLQIKFILESDSIGSTVNFGRFTVSAPDPYSTVAFYSGTDEVDIGGISPDEQWNPIAERQDGMYLTKPPEDDTNRANFVFQDAFTWPAFAPGDSSNELIVTVASDKLPAFVHLEIDETLVAGLEAGVDVELVPEPTSIVLLGMGVSFLSFKRRRKS